MNVISTPKVGNLWQTTEVFRNTQLRMRQPPLKQIKGRKQRQKGSVERKRPQIARVTLPRKVVLYVTYVVRIVESSLAFTTIDGSVLEH